MVTRKAVAAYVAASFVAVVLFLADYANTYRAFYPAMVALANSSAFRLMLVNAVVASMIVVWFAVQFIFFGKLNASEEAALLMYFTIYLTECIILPLYFNVALMSTTMVFLAFTLVWRLLHKLAAERVTTLSTVQMTLFPISRMVAYLNFVIISDVGLLIWLVQTRPELGNDMASLHYSLLLIYMLLVSSSLRSAVRFGSLFVLSGRHTMLPFVADAITSIAESLLFVLVYAYIFTKSAFPLLLLRGFGAHGLRILQKASGLVEFITLARKVRHDMPNATAEDLARDARCTICYEDMAPGNGTKRLPCGHCYHTECLEHWLEGHSTCPYCRASIMRMPSGETADRANEAGDAPADPLAAAALREEEEMDENGAPPAAVLEQHPQPQQQAVDPFAIHLRHFAAQHITATPEAELQAAYERYLNRVDPTRAGLHAAAAVETTENGAEAKSSSSSHPPRSPLPAAQAQSESEKSSPVQATVALPSQKTVEELKLKAYKKYHRRLREAEKELMLALKLAEDQRVPT